MSLKHRYYSFKRFLLRNIVRIGNYSVPHGPLSVHSLPPRLFWFCPFFLWSTIYMFLMSSGCSLCFLHSQRRSGIFLKLQYNEKVPTRLWRELIFYHIISIITHSSTFQSVCSNVGDHYKDRLSQCRQYKRSVTSWPATLMAAKHV